MCKIKQVGQSKQSFGFSGTFIVLVELLLEFGSVGELLVVVLVDFFPDVSELIAQGLFEGICMDVEPFVVEGEVSQFEQTLYFLHLPLDCSLLLLYFFFQFFSLRQVHQVDDHVGEVMRQVAFSQSLDDLAEYLVGLLRQGAFFEHVTIHLLHIHLHRIVQLVQVFNGDGDAESVEHFEDFITGQTSRAVEVELLEYFFDGYFSEEVLGKVEVAVVFAILVVEAGAEPLDEGGSGQFGPA